MGKLLGVGHIALFVYVIQAFLVHPQWGIKLLNWAHRLSVRWGDPVTGAMATSWNANRVISDSHLWMSHLPSGLVQGPYFALAVACLIVRLVRAAPGWLSLLVALPAAVYGLLAGIARFPWLAVYWPLTVVTFLVSWIVVGRTVRRY